MDYNLNNNPADRIEPAALPTPQQQSPQPPQMSAPEHSRPLLWILLAILVIVILGGLGWYFLMLNSNPSIQDNSQTQTQVKDETADWKTYTNTEYGFEVKYPSYFTYTEQQVYVSGPKTLFEFYDDKNQPKPQITIRIDKTDLSPSDIMGKPGLHFDSSDPSYKTELVEGIAWKNGREIKEANWQFTTHDISGGNFYIYDTFFRNSPNTLIRVSHTAFKDSDADQEIYHKILSTFKFTQPFSWLGDYQFEEAAPPDEDWAYKLTIYDTNGAVKVYADLGINGYQSLTRIHATAGGITDSLMSPMDIIFDSYTEDNVDGVGLKKGDILFTLTPQPDKTLAIQWKKMQPKLQTSVNNSVFKKIAN